ncbi:MAG: DUF1566 domain-containing protein [Sedimentibacter sp.]
MTFKKAKPIFAIVLSVALITSNVTALATTNTQKTSNITVTLNGMHLDFDVEPYVNSDNRTLVELRSISETLGATVSWNADSKTVTIQEDDTTLELVIDQKEYKLNGVSKTMDTSPIIVNGSTMVPIRFVSESLGQNVQWDAVKNVVLISNDDKNDYTIVTTGQKYSYDNEGNVIDPTEGEDYYGQDSNYSSAEFSFTDNGDNTVTDNNTNLTWQVIPSDEQMTWDEAVEYCENLELGGYDDWRMPTLKEAFSISDFETGWPYLDQTYFDFPAESMNDMPPMDGGPQGGLSGGPQGSSTDSSSSEMMMPPPPTAGTSTDTENTGESSDGISKSQGQFWTSNYYLVGTTHEGAASAFGVNHATGHIKSYPADAVGMGKYVRAVRGDEYGVNVFVDNSDGTISDQATGLMWMQDDSGLALDWDDALEYAENFEYAGFDDWRLPDVKELQSIVDYSGCYPAIDSVYFNTTELEANEFYYFWTNTSAYFSTNDPGYGYAWYVAFGYAVDDEGNDTHGAGAVRFSPKTEDSSYVGEGGDNILNSIRLVRNITE